MDGKTGSNLAPNTLSPATAQQQFASLHSENQALRFDNQELTAEVAHLRKAVRALRVELGREAAEEGSAEASVGDFILLQSGDGSFVGDCEARLCDRHSGKNVLAVAYDASGTWLASGGADMTVAISNTDSTAASPASASAPSAIQRTKFKAPILCLSFSPPVTGGRRVGEGEGAGEEEEAASCLLAVGAMDGSISMLAVDSTYFAEPGAAGRPPFQVLKRHQKYVVALAWNGPGMFASASYDRSVNIYGRTNTTSGGGGGGGGGGRRSSAFPGSPPTVASFEVVQTLYFDTCPESLAWIGGGRDAAGGDASEGGDVALVAAVRDDFCLHYFDCPRGGSEGGGGVGGGVGGGEWGRRRASMNERVDDDHVSFSVMQLALGGPAVDPSGYLLASTDKGSVLLLQAKTGRLLRRFQLRSSMAMVAQLSYPRVAWDPRYGVPCLE
jgi:hypothetical protein